MYDAQSPEAFQSAIAEMLVIFSKIGSGLLCLETGKRQLWVVFDAEMRSFVLCFNFYILRPLVLQTSVETHYCGRPVTVVIM